MSMSRAAAAPSGGLVMTTTPATVLALGCWGLLVLGIGLGMLALAVQVYRLREGEPAMRVAQQLFAFSILYLVLLFATLLAEHGFGFFRPVLG